MAIPEVNTTMLGVLESMGFPAPRAIRALHYSGNKSVEEAINWIVEHENDSDIDQMPLVLVNINIEDGKPSMTSQVVNIKLQELRQKAQQKKEEEEKRRERQREKERRRVGKELSEAKQILEENERKRMMESRKVEKEEKKRARERVLNQLEYDKAERRRKLGLANEVPKPTKPPLQERKEILPFTASTKAEQLRECLRSLKHNHMNEDAKVKRAFQTLLVYVHNIAKNPDEEKFRKIRLANPIFQDRVGSVYGGIEFLELCGFERLEGDEFLVMPEEKVDMSVLNSAGLVLNSALTNPFFGILSLKSSSP